MTDMIEYLEGMKLCSGLGTEGKEGCWMALASSLMGGKWTDQADCVDSPIRKLCININDSLSNDARNRILLHTHGLSPTLPRVFDPMNTTGDSEATKRRTFILVDAAVRVWAPIALESTKNQTLIERAKALRGLPEIADNKSAEAAYAAACAAIYAADAAAYAAALATTNVSYAADAADAAARATTYASYSAEDAANAAANAANAAANAIAAAAYAAAAAQDQFIMDHVLPVLDRMILAGPHTKIEPKVSVCEVRQRMGVVSSK